AGLFGDSDVMNLLNFYDTGSFFQPTDCVVPPDDEAYPAARGPGGRFATSGGGDDPVSDFVLGQSGGTTPTYPARETHCNSRDVTDLGREALQAIMDKRMVIDIDHAAYHSKTIMLDIADQQTPAYPLVSTHDAHGGLTRDQIARMLAAGGLIYPYKGNGEKHRDYLENVKLWRQDAAALPGSVINEQPLALGYGADANGFGGHPGPRGSASERPIQYPIRLFQGDGWPSHLRNLAPVILDLHTVEESGKFWHIDEVGMAHYGLVADFVEEVRLESGEEGLTALYNSAEAYVQMWERVYNRTTQ
ncbi:MAG: peptidase M19, partial [Gammaproteobacteria bacterium]|nr:peptidase M19 [Gammaproteobacteria bacterium]